MPVLSDDLDDGGMSLDESRFEEASHSGWRSPGPGGWINM